MGGRNVMGCTRGAGRLVSSVGVVRGFVRCKLRGS